MNYSPSWNNGGLDYLDLAIPESFNTAVFLGENFFFALDTLVNNLNDRAVSYAKIDGTWQKVVIRKSDDAINLFEEDISHIFVIVGSKDVLMYSDIADETALLIFNPRVFDSIIKGLDRHILESGSQRAAIDYLLSVTKGKYQERVRQIASRLIS